jgi:alpha-ketoglutarate-dependent taurine dioxygenase
MQVGASSETPLMWHTEDAFHPRRADLLVLVCVRNPDEVGTRVAGVRRLGLADRHLRALQRPLVEIRPDDSYPHRSTDATDADRGISTVWREVDGPCLRYDPAYTRVLDADPEFAEAYRALGTALESYGGDVRLRAGDICVVDNAVAVHGRVSFQPRFDGSDRWLKRIMVHSGRSRPEPRDGGYGQELVEPHVRIEVPVR